MAEYPCLMFLIAGVPKTFVLTLYVVVVRLLNNQIAAEKIVSEVTCGKKACKTS